VAEGLLAQAMLVAYPQQGTKCGLGTEKSFIYYFSTKLKKINTPVGAKPA